MTKVITRSNAREASYITILYTRSRAREASYITIMYTRIRNTLPKQTQFGASLIKYGVLQLCMIAAHQDQGCGVNAQSLTCIF